MESNILKDYKAKIDDRLLMLLSQKGKLYDSVIKAGSYSVKNGGKRLRPIILLEFYKICGGDDDCAYNFACALEMIHTYSLIHDDLPCMDNDDFRRGKPSCHKQFGEVLALLAGDGLLTEAFYVASKTLGIPAQRVTKATEMLSLCAGFNGMVGGQVIDTAYENKSPDINTMLEMYKLKTGALIKAAACCGAILAGADDEKIKAAEKYAENMGIAFQIIDDILDTVGDPKLLGKPIGSDQKNDKNTALSILGIDKCREMAKELTAEAINALDSFEGDTAFMKELTEYLLVREY